MSKSSKKIDDQIAQLIATAIDISDIWKNQLSEKDVEALKDNYPKNLPEFDLLINQLRAWRYNVSLEISLRELLEEDNNKTK